MSKRGDERRAPRRQGKLDPRLPWHGRNRERLDEMIAAHGAAGPDYDPSRRPVAVFDWDDTVIRNDIGDLFFYWMLRSDKLLQPPRRDWGGTSRFLTAAAAAALKKLCGPLARPGHPLPTSDAPACADEILSIYATGRTRSGLPAFSGSNPRWMVPAYAWLVQLLAGYTHGEIMGFGRDAITLALAAQPGAQQQVGSVGDLPASVRIRDQMRDLIAVLDGSGFDVWVVSGSPQPVVEVFAEMIGIPAARVVGARGLRDPEGRLTHDLAGCGPFRDGENALMPYREGKRCWINKAIFGDETAGALERNPDPRRRPVFAAGDSDSDLCFLQDATALRLVIDRGAEEVMAHARRNLDGGWMVNPMFP